MYVDYEDDEVELLEISYTPEQLKMSNYRHNRYVKNRDKYIERAVRWQKANPEKQRRMATISRRKYRLRHKDAVNMMRRKNSHGEL